MHCIRMGLVRVEPIIASAAVTVTTREPLYKSGNSVTEQVRTFGHIRGEEKGLLRRTFLFVAVVWAFWLSGLNSEKRGPVRSCDNSLFTSPSEYMRLCSGQTFCFTPVCTRVFPRHYSHFMRFSIQCMKT